MTHPSSPSEAMLLGMAIFVEIVFSLCCTLKPDGHLQMCPDLPSFPGWASACGQGH